jgi:hypothetical protein
MRETAFLLAVFLCVLSLPARADQPEAREIARLNNCVPKKVEVFQQSLGAEGQTIYRVICNLPKTADEGSKGPDALLIGCRDSLCELVRPVDSEKK